MEGVNHLNVGLRFINGGLKIVTRCVLKKGLGDDALKFSNLFSNQLTRRGAMEAELEQLELVLGDDPGWLKKHANEAREGFPFVRVFPVADLSSESAELGLVNSSSVLKLPIDKKEKLILPEHLGQIIRIIKPEVRLEVNAAALTPETEPA